jgi:mannose-6-phosphate isomerase-like protein (cupin superfamily)
VGWTELHFILDGSATFTTGGKIIGSGGGAIIEGGVSRKVQKGDAVIVPPNTPHWYNQVDGSLTYLEVRFIAPTATTP